MVDRAARQVEHEDLPSRTCEQVRDPSDLRTQHDPTARKLDPCQCQRRWTEHILLGLVREGQGVAAQVLVSLGADLSLVRQQVIQLLSGYRGREPAGPGWRPHFPVTVRETASSPKPIGDSWTVQIVRAGRTPAAFAEVYKAIENLAMKVGIDLDDERITVTSVETHDGPGLQLMVRHESGDDSPASHDDTEQDASGDEPLE